MMTLGKKAIFDRLLFAFFWQLYMAPISHPDRYSHSIDFWRNVYGIDSKYYINLNFGTIIALNLIGILVELKLSYISCNFRWIWCF